jgi:hypothetical protein
VLAAIWPANTTLGQAHSPASLPISEQSRLPDCFALPPYRHG